MSERKAPYEVLERLARAVDTYDGVNRRFFDWDPSIEKPLREYQSAIRPLRTRAEVDADKVAVVNEWFFTSGRQPVGMANAHLDRLACLCREETAPEPQETRCNYPSMGCRCILPAGHAGKHTMDSRDL